MVSSLLCYRRVWADPKLGRDLEFELALVKAKFKHSLRFVRELDNHLIAWTQHSFGGCRWEIAIIHPISSSLGNRQSNI